MDLSSLAHYIWHVRWWFVPTFALIYLVPLLRVAGFAFEGGGRIAMRIQKPFGIWEHLVFLPRDTIVTAYLIGGFLWHVFRALKLEDMASAGVALAAMVLIVSGWLMRSFRREGHAELAEFARSNPTVHPQEFFDHLICISGILRHRLPDLPSRTVDPAKLDFTDGREPRRIRLPSLLSGLWSTAWLARILVQASEMKGSRWVRRLASSLSLVWASRVVQLIRARCEVDGAERLPAAAGPQIFLYTHASFLDFALAPLVLAARPAPPRRRLPPNCVPAFLLAKDHFRDNPIYYRLLGIGRAAAALGMIFVDRGEGATASRARNVVWRATEKLVEEGAELGIYPQGTRAAPCIDAYRCRLDSSYYTVGSRGRVKGDAGHLKKGAAFIVTEAALELAAAGSDEEVTIVPVAIRGTGLACPRGSRRILSNISLKLVVGEPIAVTAEAVAGLKSPEQDEPEDEGEARYFEFARHLHHRIDVALRQPAQVHGTLERRFFEDIRDLVGAYELEEISLAVKPWRGDDCLFHATLDAIYACDPEQWRSLLGELTHLMLNFSSRDDLLKFKGRVADLLP